MKPDGLIDPWRTQLDLETLARYLYDHHRGAMRRVKLRDVAVRLLGVAAGHGSAPEVAIRNALAELRRRGYPIGSLDGPTGGVFWIATERERHEVLGMLTAQRDAVMRAIEMIRTASLEWRALTKETGGAGAQQLTLLETDEVGSRCGAEVGRP